MPDVVLSDLYIFKHICVCIYIYIFFSFHPYNNPLRQVVLLCSFNSLEEQGTERLNKLSKPIQLVCADVGTQPTQSGFRIHELVSHSPSYERLLV